MGTVACTTCTHPVPDGARFCPSCGTSVTKSDGVLEERRVVTVLFADLVGYTALAEHLDPERVKRLVESCFERLVADIDTFGGRVDKLLGDGIVALFGAPVAHEDDAERAVRAGLRMHETLSRIVEDRAIDPPLRMRVGINTGEVLVGMLAGSDYTAMGDVVNTASRLQALAPPGGVLVGSATAALCSSAIERDEFGVTAIRGREQVEQSWLITGASAAGARPLRVDVPFVGRTHERTLLDTAVQFVRGGRSGLVSIIGEAGAGKTRLADEVIGPLEGEATILRTACAPYGEASVWAPVVAGLSALLGLDPDSDAESIGDVVRGRSRELWDLQPGSDELQRFLDVISHLLGQPSPLDRLDVAGARDTLTVTLTDMLRRHAQTRMTVLWIDNLQWADPALRDQLGVVVRSLAELPFLLVTGQRPEGDSTWPPPVERPLVLQVPLGPLDRDDATELVRGILERGDGVEASDRTVAGLVARGGGNPLFLVELAGLAATCGAGSDLPGSLRALIAARLDQLPAAQRALVDNAAVLGSADAVGALVRFSGAMGQEFDMRDLHDLVAGGLLELDGRWWRFQSAVVREVAYQTLTKRVRAQRHAGVAAVLAERGAAVDDVAHHAATAAELLVELGPVEKVQPSITEHAVRALLEAATAACDTGRFATAARHASRALALPVIDDGTRRALLLVRSAAELERRHVESATADAEEALASALAAGDRAAEAEARRRFGSIAQAQGDLSTARVELGAAIDLLREIGDRRKLADGLRARGFAEVFGGSLDDARWYLGEAMAIYDEIDDDRGHAWTHQSLAWVAFQSGDYADAEVRLVEAERRFQDLGDVNGVSWAQGLLAYVQYFQRRFEEAERLAVAVESEARRRASPWAMLMMQTLLANLRLWTGRLDEAEQFAERALAGFREINDRYGIMQALAPLNRARVALGRNAELRRGVEEAISLGKAFGELGLALQGAAGVAMHLGSGEQAVALAEQVLERNRTTGTSLDEALVLQALGRCQLGHVDDALSTIEQVSIADFPFGLAARALVRAIGGDVGAAVEDASAVELVRGASYLDLALARLAGVVAASRLGDTASAQDWLERFDVLAGSVGDVVLVGLADVLHGRSGDGSGAASLSAGWRRVIDAVVVG
ncbi:MAG: adenylate/guanylate cyclase domain-containing protein [Ilumatobacteraceae bacterium]